MREAKEIEIQTPAEGIRLPAWFVGSVLVPLFGALIWIAFNTGVLLDEIRTVQNDLAGVHQELLEIRKSLVRKEAHEE